MHPTARGPVRGQVLFFLPHAFFGACFRALELRLSVSGFLPGFLGLLFVSIVANHALAASRGFVENQGQADARVLYYSPGARSSVYFTREAIVFDLRDEPLPRALSRRGHRGDMSENAPAAVGRRGRAVYVRFEGANPSAWVEAMGELETTYNFFFGSDPSSWRSGVRAYSEIVYHDLWPGVDLIYKEKNGRLTCETVARSPAAAETVRFTYDGADRVVDEANGALHIETGSGAFILSPQERPDPRGSFAKDGLDIFASPVNDGAGRLAEPASGEVPVDNPNALIWSTYLGGGDLDAGIDLAINTTGDVFVMGETYSVDFPTTPGAYDIGYNGWVDVFVTKMKSDGSSVLWGTYLGSSDAGVADVPVALALDASGNPVLTGYSSVGFPVTPGAYDTGWGGGDDAFVTKVAANGASLLWSTFLGGSDYDFPDALVLDSLGNPLVTGATYSANFPTTPGAYDTSYSPGGDVFVAKLSASGTSLMWSTFLGGGEGGTGSGIVLDTSGRPVITGYANAATFPTTAGTYDPSWNGGNDVFVTKLSSSGASLVWSTFLGGSGNDDGVALALAASGNVVVAGNTGSSNFPTTAAAYDPTWNGQTDVFVSALSSGGTSLLWSTFLGGSDDEQVWDLAMDSYGSPVVAGVVSAAVSTDFPTTYLTFDGSFNGGGLDGFVSALWRDGDVLMWSSFLGGSGADEVHSLALKASGDPVLTGVTDSPDFPTTPGSYRNNLNGSANDAFLAFLDIEDPTGVGDVAAPSLTSMLSCAPNPFGQSTRIRYSLARDAEVDVRVFDVLGRLVGVLDHGSRAGGPHDVPWDGRNASGQAVATGVYFVRLVAGAETFERKVMVIR